MAVSDALCADSGNIQETSLIYFNANQNDKK